MPPDNFGCFEIADAIQITKGRFFVPLQPSHPANVFDIDYEAHSLSLQCRWLGGTSDLATGDPVLYSVAQHACHIADLTGHFYGLIHDNSEAYLCDISRPLKPFMIGYYEFEAALMAAIILHHKVPTNNGIIAHVKHMDNLMIYWERDALIGQPPEPYANEATDHPGSTIYDVIPDFHPWSPKQAKREYLERFERFQIAA